MRITSMLISAALAAGIAAAAFAAPLPSQIKIGAVETLTGDNAAYGISIRKGLELGVAEVNGSGLLGRSKLRLLVMDDKADKQEGISVFSKLIQEEKVAAIIGPTLSSTAFAADPIAQAAGVPVLATSNTANGITAMGDYIFRDSLAQSAVLPGTLAEVARKLHPKRAALLYEATNEYSKSEADVAKAALAKLGIQLVATESYSHGDSDFRTQLDKLNARRPDIFVFCSLIGEAVPVLQQAREIGIDQPIVGGNGFNSAGVIKAAQSAAEGLIVGAAWFIDSPAPRSQSFVAAYRKAYGSDPDQFAAQADAAVHILATAIAKAGSIRGSAIRDALAGIRDLECSLGNFSFDENRDAVHPPVTLVVHEGQFVIYK